MALRSSTATWTRRKTGESFYGRFPLIGKRLALSRSLVAG
jgi:hypothetical protein